MTLRCSCGGALTLLDDNGASYPSPRVERYQCASCGGVGTLTLTEHGSRKSGCLADG